MKDIGIKHKQCANKCSFTNLNEMVNAVLAGNNVAILVLQCNLATFFQWNGNNFYGIYLLLQPIFMCDSAMLRTILDQKCRLTIAEETIGFQHMFMAVPKKSPYVKELNGE